MQRLVPLMLLLTIFSAEAFGERSDTRLVAQRFVDDFWNAGNLTEVADFIHPDLTIYGPSNQMKGRQISAQEMQGFRRMLGKAMPDLHYTVEDVVIEGNKVVLRLTANFTHSNPAPAGPFGIAQPTGNHVEYAVIFIIELENGLIRRVWDIPDNLARFGGMGALPIPKPGRDK